MELRRTVRQDVNDLYQAFNEHGLTADDLTGARFQRITQIQALISQDQLNANLRWRC